MFISPLQGSGQPKLPLILHSVITWSRSKLDLKTKKQNKHVSPLFNCGHLLYSCVR